MKKTTKYIIITLVVLIVLGAAAAALILTSPKDSEDDASSSGTVSESTEPALIDKTAEDVKNIGVEDLAADDSYTIIPTETTTSSGDTEQTFTIEGWDDLDVLYSNVKSLADRLYSITPTKKLGAVEDLSEYGLGSGEGYKITMNYTDGTSQTFTIGNKAGESSGSYMLYEDEVYIVPVSTYLKQSKYDFLNKSLIAIPTPPSLRRTAPRRTAQAKSTACTFPARTIRKKFSSVFPMTKCSRTTSQSRSTPA